MIFSKSPAGRRFRLSQAEVRSRTQWRGSSENPLAVSDHLMISIVQLVAAIAAVSEDVTQPWEAGADRDQDVRRGGVVLDVCRMDPCAVVIGYQPDNYLPMVISTIRPSISSDRRSR